jgi:hypothetical protein
MYYGGQRQSSDHHSGIINSGNKYGIIGSSSIAPYEENIYNNAGGLRKPGGNFSGPSYNSASQAEIGNVS